MKNFLSTMALHLNTVATQTSETVVKHKRAISFAYLFALLTSCLGTAVFANGGDTGHALWQTTQAVLDIIFPIIVVVGVILLIVGIILLFINRFNEQSITGPLIILAVGVGLILIRALLGNTISAIAFEQMYPGENWEDYQNSLGN